MKSSASAATGGTSRDTTQNKRMMKKPKAVRTAATVGARRKVPVSMSGNKKRVQVVEPIQTQNVDARKVAEAEKRLNAIQVQKDRLKDRADKLSGSLNKTRVELNAAQQERGRIQQFWRIAENGLDEERERTRGVERTMFDMKTQQANQVQRLQQKIRSLVFHAKVNRNAGTQSEPIPPTGGLESVECQTLEELTKEKAANILRQSDDLLVAFIAELEKDKLEAQSDLKYAIVHLEQRMKEEQETQMEAMKEERDIEIEEIGLKHMEQIRTIESANNEQTAMMQGKIDFLQAEISNLRNMRDSLSADLVDSRERLTEQAALLGQHQANIDEMSKEIARLQDYKKSFQRDMRNVENMRKEVEKYKELNDIIMGEFEKIEKERDQLLGEVERNLGRLEISNQQKFERLEERGKKL
ncbi:Protein CBG04559 [Caenorhabditis briggsae]|uniref:Protein CBG04559 n=1 Tax=Caenorhabditis briggsae TaxID=6238 RepID=A8WXX5_CAEBR|nr:Protein CBG04559 [Caenorhabditis briggsae]CAP25235.1 Protein CBG04559 [Caenorhabditis briggsae]